MLKLDIEGAAPRVLSHPLKAGIYPKRILCEFERPVGFERVFEQSRYLSEVRQVLSQMKKANYDIYKIRRSPFERQLEVLAVRN